MRNIFFISIFIILSGCAEYSSLLAPSYKIAHSGSALEVGNAFASSYAIKKTKQKHFNNYKNSLTELDPRECQTIHSTELNEIFFETLDEIDCLKNPFSILK